MPLPLELCLYCWKLTFFIASLFTLSIVYRGYSAHKITENVDAEMFQVCLDEAMDSYHNSIVHEMQSDTVDQMDENVEWVTQWLSTWTPDMTPAPSHHLKPQDDDDF